MTPCGPSIAEFSPASLALIATSLWGWPLLLALVVVAQQVWIFLSARHAAKREELFRIITENAADMIALVSVKGRRLYNSPAYHKVLGYTAAELARTPVFEQIHPDDRAKVLEASRQARETGVGQSLQYRLRHKDGSWRVLESSASTIRNAKGQVEKLVIVNRDVTEKAKVEEKLAHDALHDALTGVPNRRLFLDRLQRCFQQAHRDPEFTYAILFVDIDGFKGCNESLGPELADRVLVEIARRLDAALRDADTVSRPAATPSGGDGLLSRLGGDEFTVLLEGVRDPSDAMRVAQRLQGALSAPIPVEGSSPLSASVSVGIALSSPSLERADDLLNDAEIAMRRAHGLGGGRSELFDAAMHIRAINRLQLESELRTALHSQQLCVYYQPIVQLENRRVAGFEALVRWQHPTQGLISPEKFLEAADDAGLIAAIDRWVALEACQQIRRWQAKPPALAPLKIAVNLSERHFGDPGLPDEIRGILHETQIDPQCLQFEVGERVAAANPDLTVETLSQLRRMNITTVIDDFGTGPIWLAQLRRFPVSVLKVDRALVHAMLTDRASREVVELIVTLGHNWGMEVTAEGIEKAAHCAALKNLGCVFGQGFLFFPPLAAEAAADLLSQQSAASPFVHT